MINPFRILLIECTENNSMGYDANQCSVEDLKMDFELTRSQKEIQKAAKDFAKGESEKIFRIAPFKFYLPPSVFRAIFLIVFGGFLFALLGFPPFPGFWAKWELVVRLVEHGMAGWMWLILLGSILEAA